MLLSKNINITIPNVGKIIYAMIITEPDYGIYNEYTSGIECNCIGEDDENDGYFIKNNYIGRYFYCKIKIDEKRK